MNSPVMLTCKILLWFLIWIGTGYAQVVESPRSKPNIILINVDDADLDLFSESMLPLYPAIEQLARTGVSFTNVHVTTPFCGPSRASLFRCQYAHRTGVRVNIPEREISLGFAGGYSEFLRQGYDQDELGVWMSRAGYRTMMIGKYHHNGFDFRVPPGWDDFYMSNGGRYTQTYRFTNREVPEGRNYPPASDIYRTEQEADDAVRLIREHADKPFFLYIAPLAPHRPVGPDFTKMVDQSRYVDWQPDLKIPSAPDLNEADISDKPASRHLPRYTQEQMAQFEHEHRCRARAVKSVDDLVRRVTATLAEVGLSDRTFVLFTSDNGYQLGHHRQHNKLDPYDRCTRVPLFVAGPDVAKGQTANHLIAHFDIAATIMQLADCPIPDFCDGKSFASLLVAPNQVPPAGWRESVVIENWQSKQSHGTIIPGTYSGLRMYDQTYVEWATGEKSFYELKTDPFQIDNRYGQLDESARLRLSNLLRSSRTVTMNPMVSVVDPDQPTGVPGGRIKGVAEDDGMVAEVKLIIQDPQTQRYWDGSRWQNRRLKVAAKLAGTDQQLTFWSYPYSQWKHNLPDRVVVTAIAIDGDGNKSQPSNPRTISVGG